MDFFDVFGEVCFLIFLCLIPSGWAWYRGACEEMGGPPDGFEDEPDDG